MCYNVSMVNDLEQIMSDITTKQAYEWVRTGHWSKYAFLTWLETTGINHKAALYTTGGTLIHRASGDLAYEWIKTKHWNLKLFSRWLTSFL